MLKYKNILFYSEDIVFGSENPKGSPVAVNPNNISIETTISETLNGSPVVVTPLLVLDGLPSWQRQYVEKFIENMPPDDAFNLKDALYRITYMPTEAIQDVFARKAAIEIAGLNALRMAEEEFNEEIRKNGGNTRGELQEALINAEQRWNSQEIEIKATLLSIEEKEGFMTTGYGIINSLKQEVIDNQNYITKLEKDAEQNIEKARMDAKNNNMTTTLASVANLLKDNTRTPVVQVGTKKTGFLGLGPTNIIELSHTSDSVNMHGLEPSDILTEGGEIKKELVDILKSVIALHSSSGEDNPNIEQSLSRLESLLEILDKQKPTERLNNNHNLIARAFMSEVNNVLKSTHISGSAETDESAESNPSLALITKLGEIAYAKAVNISVEESRINDTKDIAVSRIEAEIARLQSELNSKNLVIESISSDLIKLREKQRKLQYGLSSIILEYGDAKNKLNIYNQDLEVATSGVREALNVARYTSAFELATGSVLTEDEKIRLKHGRPVTRGNVTINNYVINKYADFSVTQLCSTIASWYVTLLQARGKVQENMPSHGYGGIPVEEGSVFSK